MKLLAVGKSLSNIHDKPTRYKMETQNLLPTFGVDEEKPVKFQAPKELSSKQLTFSADDGEAQRRAIKNQIPEKTTMPATMTSVTSSQAEPTPIRVQAAYPAGRWTVFKNPFQRKPQARPEDAPIQGELTLSTVKPVRNDLSENDLEIIEVHQGVEEIHPDATPASPKASEPSGVIWGKISAKLFGS